MRIAVCDDEENALRQVRNVINKLSVVDEAEYYSDMDVFMERINTGIYYDIVMMDIDWNSGRTGIDYASHLYRLAPETKLIFFTGYSQRYIEAVFMKRTNKLTQLETARNLEEESYRRTLERIEAMAKLRHDFYGQLQAARYLLDESPDDGKAMVADMMRALPKQNQVVYNKRQAV